MKLKRLQFAINLKGHKGEKLAIRFDNNTGNITLSFPLEKASIPDTELAKARFYTMLKSDFHKVLDIDSKAEASVLQKSLEEKKIIYN